MPACLSEIYISVVGIFQEKGFFNLIIIFKLDFDFLFTLDYLGCFLESLFLKTKRQKDNCQNKRTKCHMSYIVKATSLMATMTIKVKSKPCIDQT